MPDRFASAVLKKKSMNTERVLNNSQNTALLILICFALTLVFALISKTYPTLTSLILNFNIQVEEKIQNNFMVLESIVKRRQIENIFYFSVTTDRFVFLEKLIINIMSKMQNFINAVLVFKTNHYSNNLITEIIIENSEFAFKVLSLVIVLLVTAVFGLIILNSLALISTIILYSTIFIISIYAVSTVFKFNFEIGNYLVWLVEESFVSRNTYIDSNYFLTNDSMKGIERFTDLAMPWYIDTDLLEDS